MYKIDITSPDVDRQIELLKLFPEITNKHYVPAVRDATRMLYAAILPNIPRDTGRAAQSFGSKVTGRNIGSLTGRVGWYDKSDPWYPNVLEHGVSKPYEMNTFAPGFGRFMRYVKVHPAMSALKFMEQGFSSTEPAINVRLAAANEAVVRELAVP